MKSAKLGEGWQRPDLEVGEGVVAERQGVQVTQPERTIYSHSAVGGGRGGGGWEGGSPHHISARHMVDKERGDMTEKYKIYGTDWTIEYHLSG